MARMTKAQKAQVLESKELLLSEYLKPGDRIWCVLRHVSKSGMRRHIDFYVIPKGDTPLRLTWHIGNVLGYKMHKDGGLIVDGCGMDMGFHVVHSLCYALWGLDADACKPRRPGYQLRSEWL